jgi:diamine N-acetyltransferase
MIIKACSESDIDELVRVSIQSYNEHYLYLWYDAGKKYVANNFNAQQFKDQLNDPNVALFLIYEGKDSPAVGFLKLNIDKPYKSYGKETSLELERIYIVRSAAGKGVGKKVLEFTDQFALSKNKKCIWLKAMDSAPATKFYQSCGYTIIDNFLLTFPEMKEEFRGMYVMLKELNQPV